MTDTYSIKFTSDGEPSGKTAISVAPTAVDNSTSIPIHGKYSTPFGEDLWTSIVHVMENFCSATGPSPTKVTMGQLWFDSTTQTLKVWKVLSVSPYTIGWAPVNSFDSNGTLSVALKTSVVDNGILDDSATYDGYYVTKGYSDAHYLPKGNYVAGTTALSKAKLKYSTDVTFDTNDTTALVTKKYVDDKVGVVGQLSFTVAPDGSMTATHALIGSANNLILDDTAAYDNYFVTRDYADDRYFRVGTFVNSDHRESKVKIRYSSDVSYATNTDDDYTLVHKKYVTEAISIAAGAALSAPASGIVLSDGSDLSNFVYNATVTGKFLSVNASGLLSWEPSGLPAWLSSTIGKGVLVSNGTTVNPIIGTGDQVLKTIDTGGVLSIGWGTGTPSWFPQAVPAKGVLTSDGTAVTSSIGTADSVLTVDSSNALKWVSKTSIAGSPIPKTKGVVYVDGAGLPQVVTSEANDTVLSIDNTGAYKWVAKSKDASAAEVIKMTSISNNGNYGYSVAVSKDGKRLVAGAPNAVIYGRRRGVAYVFVWKDDTWVEEGRLVASNAFDGDSFGSCVDINADGTRIIVGAPLSDYGGSWDSGAFYIFRRLNGTSEWLEEVFVTGGSGGPQDSTGSAVAISDDGMTIAIGSKDDESEHGVSAGWIFVYYMAASGNPGTWSGLSWSSDRHAAYAADQSQVYFGSCIAMDSAGSRYIAGGWGYERTNKTYGTGSGLAGIFVASGSGFARETWLYPDTDDYIKNGEFGWDVSMNADGSRVVVSSLMGKSGTPGVPYSGAVYVFVRNNTTWTQEARLTPDVIAQYSGYGYSVSINDDGDKILVGAIDELVNGSNTGVTYVFTRNSSNVWTQSDKLKPSDGLGGDNFGSDVSMSGSGELIVVGAQFASVAGVAGAGKIYTFGTAPSGPALTQLAILYAPVPTASAKYGTAVSLSGDGNHMVVGSPYASYLGKATGTANVYDYSPATGWVHNQIEYPSDGGAGDLFGCSTAMSANGEFIAIGAYGAPVGSAINGQVYVLKRKPSGGYSEEKIIKVTGTLRLGYSVDISNDGSTIIAGAPYTTGQTGSAYIFTMDAGGWASGYTTTPITSAAVGDLYGFSVAINNTGDKAIVGAPAYDSPGTANCGGAAIWSKNGTTWSKTTQLVASDGKASANFGWSVSINAAGDRVAVGASNADVAGRSNTGAAYIYDQTPNLPGVWIEKAKLAPSILDAECNYGYSLQLNAAGDKLIVGALDTDLPGGISLGGMMYIHTYDTVEKTWSRNPVNASDKAAGMNYGAAVSISDSGSTMAVGATGAKTPSKLSNAGGVYLYTQ